MSLRTVIARCLGERDALSVAREQAAHWQPWMHPISTDSPVGEDPGYDDDFQRMREEVNKLSGADAEQVAQLAEKLLIHNCKDLRVATYYLWARLHKDGEVGLADGLSLLAALVERFADAVLPIRPNSRKMALEWLAGGKVLDTLSLYPEVVKAEAERTAAALAWLERGWVRGRRISVQIWNPCMPPCPRDWRSPVAWTPWCRKILPAMKRLHRRQRRRSSPGATCWTAAGPWRGTCVTNLWAGWRLIV